MIKKLESLEKYVITPNVRFYGGYVYNGEDIDGKSEETTGGGENKTNEP